MAGTFSFHANHLTQPIIDVPGYGILFAMAETVPTGGADGYGKGCLFIDTDGSSGAVLYINEGTKDSADFKLALSNEVLVMGDGVTAGTWAASKFCSLDSSGDATLVDGTDFVLGTTTGTKVGTDATQKLGFYNATPIVQPSGATQAALTHAVGTADGTVDDVGAAFNQTTLNNNFKELTTLVGALRTALLNLGLIKGSA